MKLKTFGNIPRHRPRLDPPTPFATKFKCYADTVARIFIIFRSFQCTSIIIIVERERTPFSIRYFE